MLYGVKFMTEIKKGLKKIDVNNVTPIFNINIK